MAGLLPRAARSFQILTKGQLSTVRLDHHAAAVESPRARAYPKLGKISFISNVSGVVRFIIILNLCLYCRIKLRSCYTSFKFQFSLGVYQIAILDSKGLQNWLSKFGTVQNGLSIHSSESVHSVQRFRIGLESKFSCPIWVTNMVTFILWYCDWLFSTGYSVCITIFIIHFIWENK